MNNSIFSPQFRITSKLSSSLDDIDRQRWLVDNMLLMPKHEAWIRREIQVKRAAGTTQIEGANLNEPAVSRLLNRVSTGKLTEDEQANINALAAYEFIDFLSDAPDVPLDELVIRQMNRYFMRGASDTLTPGVYRKGLNKVSNFTPPDQGDVPSLMRAFALWLRQDDELHPVFKAAISHIHLVAIHPFWDGNGRTARGLATLVLQRSSFGFRKLLSLESHLSRDRNSYFTAIERALGTHFSHACDMTSWLEFLTDTLQQHVYNLVAQLADWHRMMDEAYKVVGAKGWEQRQADALMFAIRTGHLTRADYIEITGVSAATASRDLAELAKAGMLISEGKARARVYHPDPKLFEANPLSPEGQLPLLKIT